MTILDPLTALEREQLRYIGKEGDACPCSESDAWNIPSWKIPICNKPEYGEDGLCNNCYHEKKCHLVGFTPVVDYRAHCEALAGALENLINNAWASCEEEDGQLVGRATREEWDAHCEATDAACAALTRWKEDSK